VGPMPTVEFAAGPAPRVTLVGDIDLVARPVLERVLAAIRSGEPADVVVDATEVTFLSCGGLSFLSRLAAHLREHGCRVRVVASRPSVLTVLTLGQLDSALVVHDVSGSEFEQHAERS